MGDRPQQKPIEDHREHENKTDDPKDGKVRNQNRTLYHSVTNPVYAASETLRAHRNIDVFEARLHDAD